MTLRPPRRKDVRKENGPIINLDEPSVSVAGMHLGNDVLTKLFETLRYNKNVTELDLSYCDLTDDGVDAFCELIKENQYITSLTLIGNHLTDLGIGQIARCLISLKNITTITSLNLSTNPFGDVGLGELGRMLQRNDVLQELVILDCNITCEGAVNFAEMLLQNESLLFLTLPYHVGYDLITQVQRILKRNWKAVHGKSKPGGGSQTTRGGWSSIPLAPFPELPNPRMQRAVHNQLGRDPVITSTMICLALLDAKSSKSDRTSMPRRTPRY